MHCERLAVHCDLLSSVKISTKEEGAGKSKTVGINEMKRKDETIKEQFKKEKITSAKKNN